MFLQKKLVAALDRFVSRLTPVSSHCVFSISLGGVALCDVCVCKTRRRNATYFSKSGWFGAL